jgi:hypothetical protein
MVAAIADKHREVDWAPTSYGLVQVLLVTRSAAVAQNSASHLSVLLQAAVLVGSSTNAEDVEEGLG